MMPDKTPRPYGFHPRFYLHFWDVCGEDFLGRVVCNTLCKLHQIERDPEDVHVWDCTVEDDLKELIGTTYTNKMHILFGSTSLKNSIVKRVWLKVIMD